MPARHHFIIYVIRQLLNIIVTPISSHGHGTACYIATKKKAKSVAIRYATTFGHAPLERHEYSWRYGERYSIVVNRRGIQPWREATLIASV